MLLGRSAVAINNELFKQPSMHSQVLCQLLIDQEAKSTLDLLHAYVINLQMRRKILILNLKFPQLSMTSWIAEEVNFPFAEVFPYPYLRPTTIEVA